jgi:hypothetical protein
MRQFGPIGRSAFAGLLVACTAAGCGGSGGAPTPRPSSDAPSPSAAATPTAVATPGSAPAPGFPRAADGRNVRACRDGNCEILVTKRTRIPLDARFGFKTFSFDPADSTWRYTYPQGGSGSVSFLAPPYSGQWAAPGGEQGITLTVVGSAKGKAVISLRPTG